MKHTFRLWCILLYKNSIRYTVILPHYRLHHWYQPHVSLLISSYEPIAKYLLKQNPYHKTVKQSEPLQPYCIRNYTSTSVCFATYDYWQTVWIYDPQQLCKKLSGVDGFICTLWSSLWAELAKSGTSTRRALTQIRACVNVGVSHWVRDAVWVKCSLNYTVLLQANGMVLLRCCGINKVKQGSEERPYHSRIPKPQINSKGTRP